MDTPSYSTETNSFSKKHLSDPFGAFSLQEVAFASRYLPPSEGWTSSKSPPPFPRYYRIQETEILRYEVYTLLLNMGITPFARVGGGVC